MKISFVIPFHNEEKNVIPMIKRVIAYAKTQFWNYEIVAVDDRSTDQTASILKQLTKEYSQLKTVFRNKDFHDLGNTMGKSLIVGTEKACGDIVIWTMGDMTDDVTTYGEIVNKIEDNFDLVIGSRYMVGGSRGNLDPLKAWLSSWGTILARFLFGIPVHDITNAFRGFRKQIFFKIKLDSTSFSISPEFAIKIYLSGYKIGEVPTVYTNRTEGISNFKLYQMVCDYLLLYLRLLYQLRIAKKR